jgi:antirestriction protein ArdC
MSKSTEALTQAHERLTQAVESIVSGEDWQRMLRTAAKFHRYSFQNQLLISFKNPDATLVAGFNKWKSMNRSVKKGEKGIAIFAPCKYRTKIETDSGEEKSFQQLRGFRIVHVFDISQTDGEPIEDLDAIRPKLLDGDAPEGIWDALVLQADAAGFEVVRDQKRSENGYCDFLNKVIAVRPDIAPAQALKTLIHELGHALLHSEAPVRSREAAEVEVESVAFIVCDALGLDTSDYSFQYIATWSSGDVEKIKETGERVVECARTILYSLSDVRMAA